MGVPTFTEPVSPTATLLAGYNPKIYSPKLLRKFYANCVVAEISNTDYLGEIKNYGDKVIIRKTPDIAIDTYKGPGDEVNYSIYSTDAVSVTIDKGKKWGFVVEDVDLMQTDIKNFVANWTDDAAKQLDIAVDTEVLAYLVDQGDSHNMGNAAGKVTGAYALGTAALPLLLSKDGTGGTAGTGQSKNTPMGVVADAESCLSEQNLPTDQGGDFWFVGPERFYNMLATGELSYADRTGLSKAQMLDGGVHAVPNVGCFKMLKSNLLPVDSTDTTTKYMFFGHKMALAFAAQLTKSEVLRNPRGFGDLHRGLLIYGYDVIYPIALGQIVCKFV